MDGEDQNMSKIEMHIPRRIELYSDEGDELTMRTCHEEASRGRLDVAINLEANLCGMGASGYGAG